VWRTNPDTGESQAYHHDVHDEVVFKCGNTSVFYDRGLEKKLFAIREKRLPAETGGIVVGYVDFNVDAIFIVDILDAPEDSVATCVTFKRGVSGLRESLDFVKDRTANIVDYIGEWHSHPANTSAQQSEKDIRQLREIGETMAGDGLPAIQLIVAENEINIAVSESYVER